MPTTIDPQAPTWDQTEEVPQWDETIEPEVASDLAQIQRLRGMTPAQRAASFGPTQIPSSILETQHIASGYALPAEAPGRALEPITKPVGEFGRSLASEFLRSWGVAPPPENEPFFQFQAPMTREQFQQVPQAAQIPVALMEALSQTGQSFVQPENAPWLATGRPGATVLGFEQLAQLPQAAQEAIKTFQDPQATIGEKALSVAKPGAQALLGRTILSHGLADQIQQSKIRYASKNREAAPFYGDVRAQPGEGEGQVPVQEGGQGVQPQAQTQAEVLLAPALENNRSLGIGHEVKFVDDFGASDPEHITVASSEAPTVDEHGDFMRPGQILISRKALAKWMEEVPKEKQQQALQAMVSEEGIHSMTTPQEAAAYLNSLTRAERAIGQKVYLGDRTAAEVGLNEVRLGHELLRQRMQRLLRADPTEIAEAAGREKWSRKSLMFIANLIRGTRELIGTKAAKTGGEMTDTLLKRMAENLQAAADGISDERPAEIDPNAEQPFSIRRSAPTADEETNDPAKMAQLIGPVKYDGIMDFKLPGLKPKWQFTLTMPGRQTTFMLDVGSSLKDVWRKTSIKDYQFEHHISDVAEAERRWSEENNQPKSHRRKETKQEELNLPPLTKAPHGTSKEIPSEVQRTGPEAVQPLPGQPLREEQPLVSGVQGGEPASVPQRPAGREGELALPNVPAGTAAERAIPRPAATPGGLDQSATKWLETAITEGGTPSYRQLSDELKGKFGPGISSQETFRAIGGSLMRMTGEQVEQLLDSMGLRGKHPGAVADPVDVPKEYQGQFAELVTPSEHKKVKTPAAVRQAFSPALRRRYDALGSIISKLSEEAGPEVRKAWGRPEVGPEEIQHLAGERLFRPISATEAANPETLGEIATRGASVDASGVGAPPRTVSKNLLALRDKSGRVILVSAWKDPRSGPRVTNPSSSEADSRSIDTALTDEYRPLSVMTLKEPAQRFRKVFDSVEAFNKWFGEAGIEGTPGLRTSSFVGPNADISNAAMGLGGGRGAPRPEQAGLPPALNPALQGGFELPQGEMLTTPGRPPIPTGRPLYRSPREQAPPAAQIPLNQRLEMEARAREAQPYEPTRFEPSEELGKRNISIMPGARGQRPGGPKSIRRMAKDVTDELENLKDQMVKMTKSGAFGQLLSSGFDSAENTANNLGRETETAIRMASQPKAKWYERDINVGPLRIPAGMPEGNPEKLAAANVLIESGFNQPRIADFRQMVADGRAEAENALKTGNLRERRGARAWLRALDAADKELDYADKNWNDPELQATAKRMKEELNEAYKRERKAGIKMKLDPNYLPHRYVMLSKPGILGRRYRLPQTFDTYYDALKHGPYLPVTRDGATLVAHRVTQGLRRIQQAQWIEGMKGIDVEGRPLAIDPLYDPKTRRWTNPDINYEEIPQGSGDPPILALNEYSIPKVIRLLTARNVIEDSSVGKAALNVSQKLKHTLLIGDFFHLARVLYYGASIMRGKTGYAGGWSALDIADKDVPEAVRKGYISQEDADWGAESVDVTQPGGPHETVTRRQLAQKFYQQMGANLGKIQDALYKDLVHKHDPRQGPLRAGVSRALDPTIGRYNRILFDKLTRGLMAESAVREFERQHDSRPDIVPERLMRDIAKDVNTYYGNLGRQGVMKAKWQQDLARIFWLAPQWVEGLIRKEGTAYSRWSGASQLMGRRGLTYAGTTGRGIATGMGFMFGLTQAINYLTRGHSTFQNKEKGHQLDAWVPGWGADSNGFWLSPLAVFNELTHDVYRLVQSKPKFFDAFDQIAGNKESPLVRAALVWRTGRGPTGEIQTSDTAQARTGLEQLLPLPITFGRYMQAAGHAIAPGTIRATAPGAIERQLAGTFGLKIEPAATPIQRVHELAADYMKREGLIKSTGWQEVMTDEPSYSKLRSALGRDDAAGAEKIFQGILKANHTEADVVKAMKQWTERGFTGNKAVEQAFMSSLTEEELAEYSKALERKQELLEKFLDWYTRR